MIAHSCLIFISLIAVEIEDLVIGWLAIWMFFSPLPFHILCPLPTFLWCFLSLMCRDYLDSLYIYALSFVIYVANSFGTIYFLKSFTEFFTSWFKGSPLSFTQCLYVHRPVSGLHFLNSVFKGSIIPFMSYSKND